MSAPQQPTPTVGRIVHYVLGEHEAKVLSEQHVGEIGRTLNTPRAGETYPAVVLRVWSPTCVNLRVLLDGQPDHWATSRCIADENQVEGRWSWPPRA